MASISHALFLTLSGLLLAGAVPQYGQSHGAPPPPPPPPPPAAAHPSYAAAPAAHAAPVPVSAPSFGAPPASHVSSSSASSSSGGAGSGGELTVQCKASPDASGKLKYDCSGVNKDAITLKTEHFLWLESQGGTPQNLDIEIPNYSIDEFIKAAQKALAPEQGAKINILLKKPALTYNAEKDDAPKQQVGQPAVSLNYQPVDKISVHYPTQKQYSKGGSSSGGAASAPAPAGPAQGSAAPAGPHPGAAAPTGPHPGAAAPTGPYPGAAAPAGPHPGAAAPTGPHPGAAAPTGPYPGAAAPAGPHPGAAAPAGPAPGGPAAGAYARPQRESELRYYFIPQ